MMQPATLPLHIAYLASDEFYKTHQRLPGSSAAFSRLLTSSPEVDGDADKLDDETGADDEEDERLQQLESDQAEVRVLAKKIAKNFGSADLEDEDVVELIEQAADEVVRGAHASLPSTSALVGGLVAQEAIKLVTRQYIPADNTVVYNGIQQAVGVFKL